MPKRVPKEISSDTDELELDRDAEETSVEANEKPALQPFPAAMYRFAFLTALAGTGLAAYGAYQTHKNPDPRDPMTLCDNVLYGRNIINGASPENAQPGKEHTAKTLNNAYGVMNKIGFPLGDNYVGEDKIDYKRESADFFVDAHNPQKPRKYVYWSNLHQYVPEGQSDQDVEVLVAAWKDKDLRDSVRWITRYEEVDDDTFKKAAEELLHSPLACVEDAVDSSCMRDEAGNECLLLAPLAAEVSERNFKMHKDGQGQIQFRVCFRTNLHQAILYTALGGLGSQMVGNHPNGVMVNMPANSCHERAECVDAANWEVAEKYLSDIGMGCDKVEGDPGHCSLAEGATQKKLRSVIAAKVREKVVETAKKGGQMVKKGGKILVDKWKHRKRGR